MTFAAVLWIFFSLRLLVESFRHEHSCYSRQRRRHHYLAQPSVVEGFGVSVANRNVKRDAGIDCLENRLSLPDSVALFSSKGGLGENQGSDSEYRSVADVVGGLHGGKYQFGSDATGGAFFQNGDAFSGTGDSGGSQQELFATDTGDDDGGELPNWAKRMAPRIEPPGSNHPNDCKVLKLPSNADPMDGMFHFTSIEIRNQERTWEKFYAKIMVKEAAADGGGFVELPSPEASNLLCVVPSSGFLAPRGGASNACDANKPYSDRATIRIAQNGLWQNDANDGLEERLWLVVGTEEEQWSYKLEFLALGDGD